MRSRRRVLWQGLLPAAAVLVAAMGLLAPVTAAAQPSALPLRAESPASGAGVAVPDSSSSVADSTDTDSALTDSTITDSPGTDSAGIAAFAVDAPGDTARAAARSVVLRTSHLAPRLGLRLGGRFAAPAPASADSLDGPIGRPTRTFDRTRFAVAVGSIAAADALLMVALADLWYTERVAWHWYSDAPAETGIPDDGWLDDWDTYVQMDKGGHLLTTWHLARGAGAVGRWTGLSDRAAGVFGGAAALVFQSQIELLDGYDASYGASRTDLVANLVGGVLGGLQVAHPKRTAWFTSKLGYHASPYYDTETSVVGNMIKDYDGLSYWLVVRPSELGAPQWWPRWLAASAGYGGEGMEHPYSGVGAGGGPGPEHRREFYIGLDLDVLESERERLPRVLRPVAAALSFLRLPMPALQFGPAGTRWHWLFY